MIVLVTGGRDFSDRALVFRVLDEVDALSPITTVVEGEAAGADVLAKAWALARGRAVSPFPVTPEAWAALGLAAGPARNAAMLQAARDLAAARSVPLVAIAFRGGGGTADMVRRAVAVGVRTLRVRGSSSSSHVIEPVEAEID